MITIEHFKDDMNNADWNKLRLNKSLFTFSTETNNGQISHCAKYSNSNNTFMIQTIDQTGAYLRGNYELIYYCGTKWTSAYFQTFDALYKFINNEMQGA